MKKLYQYSLSSFLNENPITIDTSNYNLCKIGIQKPYSFDHFSAAEVTEKNEGDFGEKDGTIPCFVYHFFPEKSIASIPPAAPAAPAIRSLRSSAPPAALRAGCCRCCPPQESGSRR